MADEMGCAVAYCDGFAFGDQENGSAYGRHVISTGEVQLTRLQSPDAGERKRPPAVGPLVISEIMYNPPLGGDEYVELQNIGTVELPLSEPSLPEHTWKIERDSLRLSPIHHPGAGRGGAGDSRRRSRGDVP